MLKILSLQKTRRWLQQQFNPAGLILMYHRVANVSPDPFHLCVMPAHFEEQLAALKQFCHPMPLSELVHSMQQESLPKRAVAITFDDGYADNLYAAKPLLERYQIPATIFVTTDHLTRDREAWWDELERILLQPGHLPAHLSLTLQNQIYDWDLGSAASYSNDDFQRDRTWSWDLPPAQDPSTRQQLYRVLYDLIHSLPELDRQQVMDTLLTWAGLDATPRSSYRFLTSAELSSLTESGLIEIGAHTVTHPFLATLSRNAQQQEIEASKQKLEQLMHQPIQGFAYPHGNYNSETVAVVRSLGFDYACTTHHCHVRHPTDEFEIPRIAVQNWNGETFTQQIMSWFEA
jgi:peptidoglycan/xylan/chitin deacetylase (PgdA/CDA1 family)